VACLMSTNQNLSPQPSQAYKTNGPSQVSHVARLVFVIMSSNYSSNDICKPLDPKAPA
jgi:hypothetical protein